MFCPDDDDGAAALAANAVDAESVTETIGGRFSSPITESVANDTLRRLLLLAATLFLWVTGGGEEDTCDPFTRPFFHRLEPPLGILAA